MDFDKLLKSKGFTQQKLVEKLKLKKCYKYQQQISDWCRGVRTPDALTIYHIANILNVPIDLLVICLLKSAGEIWLSAIFSQERIMKLWKFLITKLWLKVKRKSMKKRYTAFWRNIYFIKICHFKLFNV